VYVCICLCAASGPLLSNVPAAAAKKQGRENSAQRPLTPWGSEAPWPPSRPGGLWGSEAVGPNSRDLGFSAAAGTLESAVRLYWMDIWGAAPAVRAVSRPHEIFDLGIINCLTGELFLLLLEINTVWVRGSINWSPLRSQRCVLSAGLIVFLIWESQLG